MEIDRILKQLSHFTTKFPKRAVEEAVRHKEEITPKLLEILEKTIERAKQDSVGDDYMGHLYALYLLSQFREPKAYPLIIEFLLLPCDILDFLLGDSLTEDGSRMLLSVCDGDLEPLRSLVENEDACEYSRGAALNAILAYEIQRNNREGFIEYCKDLFARLPREKDNYIWIELLVSCDRIYPEELYEDIKQVFGDKLVDPTMINLQDIDRTLKQPKEEVLKELKDSKYISLIDNTVEEMEGWASYEPPAPTRSKPMQTTTIDQLFSPFSEGVPIVKDKKIGRNEPCPCGSGKKYKKCCGKK